MTTTDRPVLFGTTSNSSHSSGTIPLPNNLLAEESVSSNEFVICSSQYCVPLIAFIIVLISFKSSSKFSVVEVKLSSIVTDGNTFSCWEITNPVLAII